MSSSSDSEVDENRAILQSIARSADAVIQSQKSAPQKIKKRARNEKEDNDPMVLDGLQLRLREALDKKLESSIMPRFKKSKISIKGGLSRSGGLNGGVADGTNGGVRLFRKVPYGAPAILETQSSLREKAEEENGIKQRRICAKKDLENDSESTSSSEDEAMKKSLKMLSVESSFIVKIAEAAKEKAAQNIVEAEDGEDESDLRGGHSGVVGNGSQITKLEGDAVGNEKRRKKLMREKKRKQRKKLEASQKDGVKL